MLGEIVVERGKNLSGERILGTAAEIAEHQRVPGSPGYAAAADVVLRELGEFGVQAAVHDYPADGETKTYEWTAPPAWTVRSGRLWQSAPSERLIADYDEVAQSVVVHSAGGSFEGELIHVGVATRDADYDRFDLAGRVVLACASAGDAVVRSARRGAVGVIVYPSDERSAASHDLVQYQSLFPRRGEVAGLVPAFSVSRRSADRLVRELAKGPVALRGAIEAQFSVGTLRVIEAVIPGMQSGAPSVLFSAHLCHPRGSANDNASGAATLVEVARALRASPLRASARFLWMPEFYGTLPWAAAHQAELEATEFALNLDMVGAGPVESEGPLHVFRAANHTPHYVNAVVEPVAAAVAADSTSRSVHGSSQALWATLDPPCGGSDHLVFASSPHRRPALMLATDDAFWHTDLDLVRRLDPTRMKQTAMLSIGIAAAAAPDADARGEIWRALLAYAVGELVKAAELARSLEPVKGARLLDLALEVELQRARTLIGVAPESEAERSALLRSVRDQLSAPLSTRRDATEPRPTRRLDGPLVYSVTERWEDEDREFFREQFGANHRAAAAGLLNHCDGTKTPLEIALLLSLDAGRIVDVDHVRRGIELYRKAGYVT